MGLMASIIPGPRSLVELYICASSIRTAESSYQHKPTKEGLGEVQKKLAHLAPVNKQCGGELQTC